MNREDIIYGLLDLRHDAESHISDDEEDSVFHHDIEVLDAAISIIRSECKEEHK